MTEPFLDDQSVYWVLWLNTLLHELGVPVPMRRLRSWPARAPLPVP